ncbi:HIRAN domain-containing protein [Pseudomonas aeruginosa]|uniref:HIRAN domain-containing protein n=1 Tax=Pseudomonas aeruginosa TaxID=287 RepID=UPI003CC53713
MVVGQPLLSLAGDGSYSFPVVGESKYQGALRRISGAEDTNGKRHECDAVLVHQPDNRHDKNACAVTIDGQLVGYLPRGEAKTVVALMRSKGLAEGFSVGCKAVIKGGWIATDGYRGSYGVDLDIDTGEFPATAIQKEMLRYLGQRSPRGLSRREATELRDKALQEAGSRYVQWVALEEIIEHLHSEDGRDEFFEIKKPSIKAIREAFEHFLNEGRSPEQIRDELEELVEYMIDQNPSLEK